MPSYVRWARAAFNAVAWLFLVCVGIQVYLAGLGVFQSSKNFETHTGFGYTFGLLTLVLIVLSLVGRVPRTWIAASVALLVMFGLQSVFVAMRESTPAIAALHPVNGFLIGVVTFVMAWRTRGYLRAPAMATTQPTPESPTA